jgi:hypothetical protein
VFTACAKTKLSKMFKSVTAFEARLVDLNLNITKMPTSTNHDPESGQVFSEASVPAIKITPFKWKTFCKGKDEAYRHPGPGTDTLARTAVRAVVANRRALDVDLLRDVPWKPVGREVWGELGRRYVCCFPLPLTHFPGSLAV